MTNDDTQPDGGVTTATKPGKKPQDRKPTAEAILEAEIEKEDLLADLPPLREPHRLRLKHRNVLTTILMDSGLLDDDGEEGEDGEDEKLDLRNPAHRDKIKDVLKLAEQVDEFAESIAVNPLEYAVWAEKHSNDVDVFLALLNVYANASGESAGSAS